jgi:crotonobetainyl-CoA:carnitine CoA-transferase CaiB-like acyl-CoA transferase
MLRHLKVLELASVLAGPSVGQFLAELGAEVIKVENLKTGGDVTRSWKGVGEETDDRSAYFCSVNWGKKSVALDLQTTEGRLLVKKMAAKCDVVIASYKPGDAEKLGVSYEQLKAVNPKIIYGQVTGYGADNDRVGYDAVIQAESGFMDLNGEKHGEPTKMPVALIDILAGHQLKEGLLLALLKRERTGEGSLVEVSLIQSAVASLANQATNWLVAGKLPKRQGSAHPNIAPYGESFVTKDGKRILLAVGNDKQFAELCALLDCAELAALPEFATNEARVVYRGQLHESLKSAIEKRDSDQLLAKLHAKKIPSGIIQNLQQVFDMPEAEQLLIKQDALVGVRSFVGITDDRIPATRLLPPPHFGEHTEQILKSIA